MRVFSECLRIILPVVLYHGCLATELGLVNVKKTGYGNPVSQRVYTANMVKQQHVKKKSHLDSRLSLKVHWVFNIKEHILSKRVQLKPASL